ncbi:MAG TPA: 3-hydroxyacyl-CoA dehydrogenase [Trebonia sp.]|nr:3-hydroxyacyl-CoA dehydrogenase [Trebonia sp.]
MLLVDAAEGASGRAIDRIRDRVKAQVAKGRLNADPDALDLAPAAICDLAEAGVVIEAVVEDLAVKRALFAELEQVVAADSLLASNSSSLTPTAMAAGLAHPERVVGLHFFNPVPVMRLVEVISGLATAAEAADRAEALARSWGKTVVRSAATPGFIVNRIARPYYAQAWRLLEEQAAAPEVIDAVLTGAGGFRMGPFALMDLIGHDVNEAVTRSVWASFGNDPRFAPSLAQRSLVEAGWLGRKAGRGCYDYADGAAPPVPAPAPPRSGPAFVISHGDAGLGPLLARSGVSVQEAGTGPGLHDSKRVDLPGGAALVRCAGLTATALAAAAGRPVIVVDRTLDDATATAIAVAPSAGCPADDLDMAVGLLQAAGLTVFVIDDVPGLVVTRTVAMLANLAADALAGRVASAADIDTAMRLGVNYPQGPLAWAGQWGLRTVLATPDELENWYRDGHYRPSPLLRRAAATNGALS